MKIHSIRKLFAVAVLIQGAVLSGPTVAAVPAPPVIQQQGIPDGVFNNLSEPVCRNCHNQNPPPNIPVDPTYLPDRHHLNVGLTIPPDSDRPNPDPNGDGTPETVYECLSCHSLEWNPVNFAYELVQNFRNCINCHHQDAEATVHHKTTFAANQDCKACHGGLINNPGDGHYVPTYQPSLVTPWPSGKPNGDDSLVNSAGTSPGNCNFCHNTADGMNGDPNANLEDTWLGTVVPVYQNMETHHSTGLAVQDPNACTWCHDTAAGTGYKVRQCEACHGVSTLHNIVGDGNADGNIMPGQEPGGYSHTGAQSDCWGCHGNNGTILSMAPGGGPGIPGIHSVDTSAIEAGTTSTLTLAGANFTNYIQNPWTGNFDMLVSSVLRVIDGAGNATDYVPSSQDASSMVVDLPDTLAPGNYQIVAAKGPSTSNPMNLTVTPAVSIDSASCSRRTKVLTVTGSGFGEYLDASDSGTSVVVDGETGSVTSWTDTEITADFSSCSNGATATVNTVFASDSASVTRTRR
ncbi:MAG: hypothetical protein P8166_01395 [Candidatus Thiodiazotropha sp.]